MKSLVGSWKHSARTGLESKYDSVSCCQLSKSNWVRHCLPLDISMLLLRQISFLSKSSHPVIVWQLVSFFKPCDSVRISLLQTKKNFLNKKPQLFKSQPTSNLLLPYNVINYLLFFLLSECENQDHHISSISEELPWKPQNELNIF